MAEKDHLILTAIGPDRVGLVEQISNFISGHGCNIEDSKMAAFCDEFAVIILISGNATDLREISRNCSQIESGTGLSIVTKTPKPKKPQDTFTLYKLTASCMDHPGVVHKISQVLSSLGVNIEAMETKTYSAPMSGTPLFQLEARLAIPGGIEMSQLRERLAAIQRQENIDIAITFIND